MIRRITFLFLTLCCLTVNANDRNESSMRQIAINALTDNASMAKGNNVSLGSLKLLAKQSQYSIYGIKGRGFVVVSKDDAFQPVLGISETDYDINNLPDGLRWWLRETERSLSLMKANGEILYDNRTGITTYGFLKTQWDQLKPYNLLCPVINDTNAPTGCVATTLAQIMNYYQYPAQGKGYGGYSVTTYASETDNEGTTKQFTNQLINGTYDWSGMKDSYRSTDDAQGVATLMFDAGKAVDMNYAASGSGAMSYNAARALFDNFSYDSLAVNCYDRMFFSDDEWMNMIETEIANKRPVYYAGSDSVDGGHAFVLDGVNSEGQVHINWGWSGAGNGYYSIDQLRPYNKATRKYLSNGEGFTESQEIIIGIKPQQTPDANEENTSYWVTSGYDMQVNDNKLFITLYDLVNYGVRYFSGKVDLVFENTQDTLCSPIYDSYEGTDSATNVPSYSGFSFYDENLHSDSIELSDEVSELAAGTYNVYLASKSNDEKEYKKVRTIGGPLVFTLTKAADGSLSLGGNATAIRSVNVAKESDTNTSSDKIYRLDGSLVHDASVPGIYIQNGKKFIKK